MDQTLLGPVSTTHIATQKVKETSLELNGMGVLIIHAGLPKTGTSTIQAYLHASREQLFQHGILWPEAVLSRTDPRHVFLHREPLVNGNSPSLVEALHQARRSRLDTVVVSSEGLTVQSELLAHIDGRSVRDALKDWKVQIAFGVRDREKWELSLYKQCVMNPVMRHSNNLFERTYGTGELFQKWRMRPEITALADVNVLARRLNPLFGDVEIITFTTDKDAVSSFMSAVGLGHVALVNTNWSNVSPSTAEIEILRRLNASAFSNRLNSTLRGLLSIREGMNHIGLATFGRPPSRIARLILAGWLASIRFQVNPGINLFLVTFEKTRRELLKECLKPFYIRN